MINCSAPLRGAERGDDVVTEASTERGEWWEALYDDTVADILLERRDRAELDATLDFLARELRIGRGSTVFDQCCGIGSLSIPLASRGANVTGIDLAASYIRRAQASAQAAGTVCRFERADAFEFATATPCDAAFNWWTSFGYSHDDARNRSMLERAHDSLKPGGRFALDYLNVAMVLKDFKPCLVLRPKDGTGETILLRECELDLAAGMMNQIWTTIQPGGRRVERRSTVRLYLPHVLAGMLEACGFSDIELYGGVLNEPLRVDSPRCICVATKGS